MHPAIATTATTAIASRDLVLLFMLTSTSPPLKPNSPFDLNVPKLVLGRLLLLRFDLLRLICRRLRFDRGLQFGILHRHADLVFNAVAADHDGAHRPVCLYRLLVAQILERDPPRRRGAGLAGLAQHQRQRAD